MSSRTKQTVLVLLLAMLAACGRDPAALLAEAEASFASREYRTAMIHALNLLEEDPGNVDARLLLGKVSLALGDVADAGTQLGRARDAGAPVEAYAVPLATAHARVGRIDEALGLLDSVAESRRDAEYVNLYADLLIANGDFDRAADVLAQNVGEPQGPRAAGRLAVEARLHLARNDVAAAEAAAARALEIDASDPDLWVFAARLSAQAGEAQEAETRLLRAVELFEQKTQVAYVAPTLLELVQLQLSRGDIGAAESTAARLSALEEGSPAASYAAGLVAYEKGEFEASVDALRRAAVAAPGDPQLQTLLGAAYLAAGNLGQAEQQFAAAADQFLNTATIRLLVETRLRRNRPREAQAALDRLPDETIAADPGLLALRGTVLLANGDATAAIAALEQAVEASPDSTGPILQLTRAYIAAGRSEDAASLVNTSSALSADEAFTSNLALMISRLQTEGVESAQTFVDGLRANGSDSAATELISGTLAFLTGNRTEAELRAQSALRMDADFVPAYLLMASLELDAGRPQESEARLRQALAVAPGHPAATLGLARLRVAQGDLTDALQVLGEVSSVDAPIEVMALRGAVELQSGDLVAAEATAATLRQRFPNRAAGHSLQGEVEAAAGRNSAAATAFAAAYELEPGYGTLQRAVALARAAGSSSWERLIEQRLAAQPNDMTTRMLLADALLAEGRSAEALVEYREVLSRNAENPTALNNAAWLAHDLGEPGALDYARRAKALAPDNASILDTLGWLLTEAGRAEEGLPDLETAAELAPAVPEIRYHLAVAQARTGQLADARANLEAVLADAQAESIHGPAATLLDSL